MKLTHVRSRLFRSTDNGETFTGTILSTGANRDFPECPTFAPEKFADGDKTGEFMLMPLNNGIGLGDMVFSVLLFTSFNLNSLDRCIRCPFRCADIRDALYPAGFQRVIHRRK